MEEALALLDVAGDPKTSKAERKRAILRVEELLRLADLLHTS